MEVDKGDISSGYGSTNIHTDLQKHYLESFMKDNDKIDIYMNETL